MMDTLRFKAILCLRRQLEGRNVADLARQYSVTIEHNKGWVGQTLDRVAKTVAINSSLPDGADFELKSVRMVLRNGAWFPAETMAVTMFNPARILTETFETSALWHKLQRLILVGHSYPEGRRDAASVVFVAPFDVSDPELIDNISSFWQSIRDLVRRGEIASYSSKGTSTGFIQLRTKGSGKSVSVCPVTGQTFKTRAFYATKPFINYVRGNLCRAS